MPTNKSSKGGSAAPGDALVDFSMCFPDLERLRQEFDVIYFCDLCAGIEAAVLNERLFGLLGSIGGGSLPILEPLAGEGVLHTIPSPAGPRLEVADQIMHGPRNRDLMARLARNNFCATEDLPVYNALVANATSLPTSLFMEEELDIPLVLTAHALPIYTQLPSVRRQQQVFLGIDAQFATTYEKFRQTLEQLRKDTEPETTVLVPPIALEALIRASTFDELGAVVVDLRHQYRALRRRFSDLDEVSRLKNFGLRNKRTETTRILLDINKTQDYIRATGVPVLTETADDIGKVFEAFEGAVKGASDWSATFKLGKVAKPLAQLVARVRWRLRMRPLLQTIDRYLSLGPADLANATKVLFNHELDDDDLAQAKAYQAAAIKCLA